MTQGTIERQFGAEIREDLRLAAESSGCEILEAEFEGGRLRIVLDHPEGTTIEHCEEVSRKASALLDVTDFGDSRYVLEVSSPGLDRKLYGPRDFSRFAGRLARVPWHDPGKGKRTDVGRLAGEAKDSGSDRPLTGAAVESGRIALLVGEGQPLEVPMSGIIEARLEVEI